MVDCFARKHSLVEHHAGVARNGHASEGVGLGKTVECGLVALWGEAGGAVSAGVKRIDG